MYNPIYIDKFKIYDIFYKNNNIYIVRPTEFTDTGKKCPLLKISLNNRFFTCAMDTRAQVYRLECDYTEYITLTIEDEIINNIKVSLYPILKDEVILTTLVKNEDNYIVQWINYHLLIGFTKFIIYDNKDSPKTIHHSIETTSNLEKLLKKYIDNNQIILINWKYPYSLYGYCAGQYAQQNHSLYAFRDSKYMGFIDIDEYININNFSQQFSNINVILDSLFKKNTAGIQIWCKFFQNVNNMPTNNYEFLKITDYFININGDKDTERFDGCNSPKCIVSPEKALSISIHGFKEANSFKNIPIKNYDSLYFNHYYFINKEHISERWRNARKCIYKDNSLVKYCDILNNKKN